ncbi:MAG: hypothetical protein BA066_07570, partial [Candidatus Korarchaeota archaeon NZ13-K]
MQIVESLERVIEADDDSILRALADVESPPLSRVSYADVLHPSGVPPQPELEFIDPGRLRVDAKLFLGVDLLASLGHPGDPESLRRGAEDLL